MVDAKAFNEGLKACQLGLIELSESPGEAVAWLTGESALPLAAMGHRDKAERAIVTAREYHLSDPSILQTWTA